MNLLLNQLVVQLIFPPLFQLPYLLQPHQVSQPTHGPTNPTLTPTALPSSLPSFEPTPLPSSIPSGEPTSPTSLPSSIPSALPSSDPSVQPTTIPTNPTSIPSVNPTADIGYCGAFVRYAIGFKQSSEILFSSYFEGFYILLICVALRRLELVIPCFPLSLT